MSNEKVDGTKVEGGKEPEIYQILNSIHSTNVNTISSFYDIMDRMEI